jgi:hypothetical protein
MRHDPDISGLSYVGMPNHELPVASARVWITEPEDSLR